MSSPAVHDAAAAAQSVCGDAPQLEDFALRPLSVQVYSGHTGVVHYAYEATVAPQGASRLRVTGKWTEVYVKEAGHWLMVAVSGKPETQAAVQ